MTAEIQSMGMEKLLDRYAYDQRKVGDRQTPNGSRRALKNSCKKTRAELDARLSRAVEAMEAAKGHLLFPSGELWNQLTASIAELKGVGK